MFNKEGVDLVVVSSQRFVKVGVGGEKVDLPLFVVVPSCTG